MLGAYLHGWAVLGGLRPRSDIDVIAVSRKRTAPDVKRALADLLLDVSARGGQVGPPRPVEFDLFVEPDVRPWRYPPPVDFQYSELTREEFERGEIEPRNATNPDLAALITMARTADRSLLGPSPTEMFEPVPRADYHDALLKNIDIIDGDLVTDTRNVILTFARIWAGLATDDVHSKDSAAG